MRLVYRLFVVCFILLASCVAGASEHAELDRRLQALKTEFVQAGRQFGGSTAAADRFLLGRTEKSSYELQGVALTLNGKNIYSHNYIESENRSLREGGLQTLLETRLPVGRHQLVLHYRGKTADGKAFKQAAKFSMAKSSSNTVTVLTLGNKGNSVPSLSKREY